MSERGSVGREGEALRVRLLGGFQVSIGPEPIENRVWRSRKAAALVKLLALTHDHRLHREQVAELLWPSLGKRATSNNLCRTLHDARMILD